MTAALHAFSPSGGERLHSYMAAARRQHVLYIVARSDAFREDFYEYLDANWQVWLRFQQEADKIRARGRSRYSARTIGEVLRHESALSDDSGWKLNDHIWPDMARLYLAVTPEARGFFELRGR